MHTKLERYELVARTHKVASEELHSTVYLVHQRSDVRVVQARRKELSINAPLSMAWRQRAEERSPPKPHK